MLIDDDHRSDGVRDGTGAAGLPDMVEGRSKQAFTTWLADRDQAWTDGVEVVAMDGFTGSKSAAAEELPDAVAVMDPFLPLERGHPQPSAWSEGPATAADDESSRTPAGTGE